MDLKRVYAEKALWGLHRLLYENAHFAQVCGWYGIYHRDDGRPNPEGGVNPLKDTNGKQKIAYPPSLIMLTPMSPVISR